MLAMPISMRAFLRRVCCVNNTSALSKVLSLLGLVSCCFLASTLFFAVTNFAHWRVMEMYPHTFHGLWHCYVQALPFFRYTLMGDLFFGALLFGLYASREELALLRSRKAELVQ